jgi:chorismate mutase
MDFSTQDMRRMSQIAGKMQGKSEDQVIRELAEMIRTGESGLTPEKAEQMFHAIMPMLNQEQKSKIKKLLEELR